MASYSTNEFKGGLKIMIDGDPCSIIENEFVKPGKGQAFNRVRVRNLKTGRVIERTFKSGDSLEAADVIVSELMYHPPSAPNAPEDTGQEFIELFNRGDAAANLVDWRFTSGVDFRLERRLAAVQHRPGVHLVPVFHREQVRRLQEDRDPVLPGHAGPGGVGLEGGLDGLLDLGPAAPVPLAEDVTVVVGHDGVGQLPCHRRTNRRRRQQ